jgi:transposase
MRSGTRTYSKRRWTPRGHRPVYRIRLGYTFCYLYAAIAPLTGTLIALILPEKVTRVCFEAFVEYLRGQTRRLFGHRPVMLIADQAGSHQSSAYERWGIALEPLPTACPELNPVERFFEELRKELSNHIFNDIEQVENYLSQILNKYWQHPQTLIHLCYYPYMRTTKLEMVLFLTTNLFPTVLPCFHNNNPRYYCTALHSPGTSAYKQNCPVHCTINCLAPNTHPPPGCAYPLPQSYQWPGGPSPPLP